MTNWPCQSRCELSKPSISPAQSPLQRQTAPLTLTWCAVAAVPCPESAGLHENHPGTTWANEVSSGFVLLRSFAVLQQSDRRLRACHWGDTNTIHLRCRCQRGARTPSTEQPAAAAAAQRASPRMRPAGHDACLMLAAVRLPSTVCQQTSTAIKHQLLPVPPGTALRAAAWSHHR